MTGLVFWGIFRIGFVFSPLPLVYKRAVTVKSIILNPFGKSHVPPRFSYSTSFNCPGGSSAMGICRAMENSLVYHAIGQYNRFRSSACQSDL